METLSIAAASCHNCGFLIYFLFLPCDQEVQLFICTSSNSAGDKVILLLKLETLRYITQLSWLSVPVFFFFFLCFMKYDLCCCPFVYSFHVVSPVYMYQYHHFYRKQNRCTSNNGLGIGFLVAIDFMIEMFCSLTSKISSSDYLSTSEDSMFTITVSRQSC